MDLGIAWKSNSFFQARLKLTFFYLLILSGILVFFSAILFFYTEHKISNLPHISQIEATKIISEKFPEAKIGEVEFESGEYTFVFLNEKEVKMDAFTRQIFSEKESRSFQEYFSQDFEEILLLLNLLILFLSGFLAWFLAGKTLEPIKQKMEEQKRFIADSSHELKNPLSAISATCESMIRANQKEGFEEILEESERLICITENLLVLDRAEKKSGKTEIDLKILIENILEKIKPLATEKRLFFETHLENFQVLANEDDLEKIVFNLLHNAIKFSHKNRKIIISLTENGKFSVQDFGVGITEENVSKIFERFYKADGSRSFEKESGAGLGLSIVKELVEKYGWKIEVESKENSGTNFQIFF
ncbi:MAG: HAMP domain-containing histidine kinase [Candidatus Peribacteria bacterium]|nr:MAG: HAMP domain-containing histidine kinase [Candidatus Peribacteria bacterium]